MSACALSQPRTAGLEEGLLLLLQGHRRHPAPLLPPPRVPWAEARARFFNRGKNRASLDCIDRAAFFLALDEEAQGYSPEREDSLSVYAKSLLHGHCDDR